MMAQNFFIKNNMLNKIVLKYIKGEGANLILNFAPKSVYTTKYIIKMIIWVLLLQLVKLWYYKRSSGQSLVLDLHIRPYINCNLLLIVKINKIQENEFQAIRIVTRLTLNLSHKWSPPKEKSAGHIDEALLELPGSTGCK